MESFGVSALPLPIWKVFIVALRTWHPPLSAGLYLHQDAEEIGSLPWLLPGLATLAFFVLVPIEPLFRTDWQVLPPKNGPCPIMSIVYSTSSTWGLYAALPFENSSRIETLPPV